MPSRHVEKNKSTKGRSNSLTMWLKREADNYVEPAPDYSGIRTYTQRTDHLGMPLEGGPVTLAHVAGYTS